MASIFPGLESERGCCSAKGARNDLIELSNVQNPTYGVSATYYKLGPNLTTTLMLNNKGPEPILAMPRIYSLSGTRLDLAPISVPATSYLEVDMNVMLAAAGPDFREGSLKINYQGGEYQMGAQVKMVNEQNGLIWAEQLVYTSKFVSNKLESVWWLPNENMETRLVVSNTSYSSVTVTLSVDGTTPQQSAPVQITLARSETRVLDIMADLVGSPNGTLHIKGGVSITHTGNPGAVLARMFIAKPSHGYSAAVPFIDPENTVSQRWHGNGFRFRNVNGAKLESGIAVRNIGSSVSRVKGKIIYTQPNGDVSLIHLPERQIPAGSTRTFDLGTIIDNASVPASVKIGGIEIEYDTPKGSIITLVQSGSSNGEHIFQVPMFDPQNMPSSAGGFPWKADSDFRTIVYIKNETDQPRKFTADLLFEGGKYGTGLISIKPGETKAIDFRQIRDDQTPDVNGNTIPLYLEQGQIAWSVAGNANKTLSGRSEQISLSRGIASTYSCANCCPNSFFAAWLEPDAVANSIGGITPFLAMQQDTTCFGTETTPYQVFADFWDTTNQNVAEVEFDGTTTAVGIGQAEIQAFWNGTVWYNLEGGFCDSYNVPNSPTAPIEVVPLVEILRNGQVISNPSITTNVSVGERIDLSSRITDGTGSNSQWSIPGTRISNYTVTYTNETGPTSAIVTELAPESLNQTTVQFYWIDGANPRIVEYSVNIGNQTFTAQAKFNVRRPTVTLSSTTADVGLGSVTLPDNSSVFALHYGSPTATPGITFSASATLPPGVAGQIVWVQVVNLSTRKRKPNLGNEQVLQGAGLDTLFPMGIDTASENDSPLQPLDPSCDYTSVSANDSFSTFLMFKPQVASGQSIYVPLRHISWSWAGTGTRGSNCTSWTLSNVSRTVNPQSMDTLEHPEWVANITQFEFR